MPLVFLNSLLLISQQAVNATKILWECLYMDGVAGRAYEILMNDLNAALKCRDKFKTFSAGYQREQDYILSHDFYFKIYTNLTSDDPHYFVIKRDWVEISGYPDLKSDMKKEFLSHILMELEGYNL